MSGPTRPRDWSEIGAGSHVLMTTGFLNDVWYDAICVRALDQAIFEVAWRDYPHEPNTYRRLDQLALLPPLTTVDGPISGPGQ